MWASPSRIRICHRCCGSTGSAGAKSRIRELQSAIIQSTIRALTWPRNPPTHKHRPRCPSDAASLARTYGCNSSRIP
eukprot:5655777-Alexandrium_andersonii.AAC.1